ncbi:acyltransferase family protein [Hathewaya limosa]|uniref:Fucose 4-O-acetylase-like acetyltransferase n=1 Tax=Hathewaya limosa TaxID=1536 RepID=A0ABU0JTV1_HATLI|nr:fucose 4-O-acetylase-like acetyltransferase [Hathewaya limosa]
MHKRLDWIDSLRGIAILLVILGHCTPYIGHKAHIWHIIYSFHIPLFFIISGYLFKEKNFLDLILKDLKRLLLPYIITLLILLIYNLLKFPFNSYYIFKVSLLTILYGSGPVPVFIPYLGSVGCLWFLPTLFLTRLIFNLFLKVVKNKNIFKQILVLMFLVIMGYILKNISFLPWGLDLALVCQLFFFIGYTLNNQKVTLNKLSISSILIMIFLWYICIINCAFDINLRIYRDFIIFCTGSISGSILVIYLWNFLSNIKLLSTFFIYVGKNSLIILCVHFLETNIIPWNILFKYNSFIELSNSNLLKLILLKFFIIITTCILIKYITNFIKRFTYIKI